MYEIESKTHFDSLAKIQRQRRRKGLILAGSLAIVGFSFVIPPGDSFAVVGFSLFIAGILVSTFLPVKKLPASSTAKAGDLKSRVVDDFVTLSYQHPDADLCYAPQAPWSVSSLHGCGLISSLPTISENYISGAYRGHDLELMEFRQRKQSTGSSTGWWGKNKLLIVVRLPLSLNGVTVVTKGSLGITTLRAGRTVTAGYNKQTGKFDKRSVKQMRQRSKEILKEYQEKSGPWAAIVRMTNKRSLELLDDDTTKILDMLDDGNGDPEEKYQALPITRNMELIELEESDFSRSFNVYSSDKSALRKVLTPKFRRGLTHFDNSKLVKDIRYSFYLNHLVIVANLTHPLFEIQWAGDKVSREKSFTRFRSELDEILSCLDKVL